MNNRKIFSKIIMLGVVSTIIVSNVNVVPVKAFEVNNVGGVVPSSNSEEEDTPAYKFTYSTSTAERVAKILGGSLNSMDIHLTLPSTYSYKPIGIIGDNAFNGNDYIQSVKLPDTITNIGVGAFLDCRNLEKVNMPQSLETIGKSAFQNTKISEVKFSNGLISIGCMAFAETPIKSINIPASTAYIDGAAFAGSDLSEINVDPANIKFVSEHQMILTKDKSTVVCCAPTVTDPVFDGQCTMIGENSFALNKMFQLKLPNNIKDIGVAAFEGCPNLSSVVLPKNITELKEQVFCGCDNLTSVIIPDSVKKIADDTFKYCKKLTIIASKGSYAEEYAKEKGFLFRDIATMENPYKEKNALIIIPGIAGSRLYDQNDYALVWEPTFTKGNTDIVTQLRDIRNLGYDENGNSIRNIGPYKVNGSIVDKVTFANNPQMEQYGTQDAYTDLVFDLKKKYKDLYDDVVYFPYEWRSSNNDAVAKLDEYINLQGYSKVTLVAHSMGGIIASKYIENGNKDKVDKLITIGTPYLGAPKALYVFETGHFLDGIIDDPLTFKQFKEATHTIPSIYELLPNQYYFQNYSYVTRDGNDLSFDDVNNYISSRSWCNKKYLDNSAELYSSILSTNGNAINDVDSYVIVGENVKTINKLKINIY